MGKMKQMMEDKSELAMMGKFVSVENDSEVEFITNYILTVLGKEEALKDSDLFKDHLRRYDQSINVKFIGTNRIEGMPCITYCVEGDDIIPPFTEDYGSGYPASFCYVFNLDAPDMCSEFGDCFFEEQADNYYHRIS